MSSPVTLPGSLRVSFGGEALVLLPDRAVWWPVARTLIVADLHVGKAASFRSGGIPVPTGGTSRDLARLKAMLGATAAGKLLLLGDLLHARAGRHPETMEVMRDWRAAHESLEVILIRGNHDRSAGRVPQDWKMREVEEPHVEGGLAFVHHPEVAADRSRLAGHVHPVTTVRDFDGSAISVPSFVQEPDLLILPSFGTFTGGHAIPPRPGRRTYKSMGGRVIADRASGANENLT